MSALPIEGDDVRLPGWLVVAPEPGTFRPPAGADAVGEGRSVRHGTALGTVETLGRSVPVTSAFAGRLAVLLASDGERVRIGQPVAWLHAEDDDR